MMNGIEYLEMMHDLFEEVAESGYPEDLDPSELHQASDEDLDNWYETDYNEKDWI